MISDWQKFLPASIRSRLEGRMQVQSILSNITWLSLDKILRMGVGLIVGVWVARYLGADQFGQLNFAQAFVVLFSPLALLGLDSIAIRDLVSRPEQQDSTLGTSFVLRFVGSMGGLVLAILAALIFRPEDQLMHVLVVLGGVAFLFQSFDVIDFWFQARVLSKYVVYARNFAFLCIAAAKVVLILLHASLIWFAWAALVEIVIASAGLVFFFKRQDQRIRAWQPNVKRAKELLLESWPLFLAGISIALYMRIDQVMIGTLLDNTQVGIYSVAIKMVEIWYFLPMTIVSSVYPALIKAKTDDTGLYHRRLQMLYDTMSIIATAIALVTSVFATQILNLFYGEGYAAAAPILSVYAWASIPVFLNVASSQHLVIENRTRISLYRTFAGSAVNIALNFVLIPMYGAVGAAIASLVSYTTATFLLIFDRDLLRQAMMMIHSMNPIRWMQYATKARGI